MVRLLAVLAAALGAVVFPGLANSTLAQTVVDFEELSLDVESNYNGADLAGGFESAGVHFSNEFNSDFGSWSGFAYSNMTDNTTPGWLNQYSAFPGSGNGGSRIYGIGFVSTFSDPGIISLPANTMVDSIAISNSTYTALSLTHGDDFAKKFGGESGNDPDYLRLDILGLDSGGKELGKVETYLADFRSPGTANDYILDTWQSIDLSSLGEIASLQFEMETTDVGEFGANTPFYFAFDDLSLSAVPEPAMVSSLFVAILAALGIRRFSE